MALIAATWLGLLLADAAHVKQRPADPTSAFITRRAAYRRSRSACVASVPTFAECVGQLVETGAFVACMESVPREFLPANANAIVDDVVAGIFGGAIGVMGTLFALEFVKEGVQEKLKCAYCQGAGALRCGACFGEGCSECNGTGMVVCVSCAGSGRSVSTALEKEQFRAIFGLFPEMEYGPEAQARLFEEWAAESADDPDLAELAEVASAAAGDAPVSDRVALQSESVPQQVEQAQLEGSAQPATPARAGEAR